MSPTQEFSPVRQRFSKYYKRTWCRLVQTDFFATIPRREQKMLTLYAPRFCSRFGAANNCVNQAVHETIIGNRACKLTTNLSRPNLSCIDKDHSCHLFMPVVHNPVACNLDHPRRKIGARLVLVELLQWTLFPGRCLRRPENSGPCCVCRLRPGSDNSSAGGCIPNCQCRIYFGFITKTFTCSGYFIIRDKQIRA